jgi:uncharacterized membrane protein YqiK
MALFGLPLWLFLFVFIVAMILIGILLWYLEKLVWYLVGRAQESEFDKARDGRVKSRGLPSIWALSRPGSE